MSVGHDPILNPANLPPKVAKALEVLSAQEVTNEAMKQALTTLRRALLDERPTASPNDLIYAVSELAKRVHGDRHSIPTNRMRRHLVERGEIKKPKLQPKPSPRQVEASAVPVQAPSPAPEPVVTPKPKRGWFNRVFSAFFG